MSSKKAAHPREVGIDDADMVLRAARVTEMSSRQHVARDFGPEGFSLMYIKQKDWHELFS